MNTVRILICATFALLIAALVHSYTSKDGEPSISELKEELEREQLKNKLKRERAAATGAPYEQYNSAPYTAQANAVLPLVPVIPVAPALNTAPAAFVNPLAPVNPVTSITPVVPEVITPIAPSDDAIAKISALEAENALLKKKRDQQEAENNLLNQERGVVRDENLAQRQSEEARAAEIAQALVMARVKVYASETGIILLDLVRAQNLTTGQILGIRRGTAGGIIGRVKLGHIQSAETGFADPIAESFFGAPVDVRVGDEIIVIP